jgi:TolB-like protein
MNELRQAVFLSYASEDATAARRLCDGLRSAGINVWFDQSELRGGEAWDASIRTRVSDCALFVAIISANTQSREEGYFRREWNLAVDRTMDMADNKTFLLPVTVDGTSQRDAMVPDKFRKVQWTHLAAGDPSPKFVDRVRQLLGANEQVRNTADGPATNLIQGTTSTRQNRSAMIIGTIIVCILAAGLAIWIPVSNQSEQHNHSRGDEPNVLHSEAGAPDKSIAVLPFVDLSEKKDQEYFSDGLAEELLDLLSRIPELRVAARTSAFSFKGKSDDIPTIAKKLHVANVMEGSVRKSGTKLRITVQLIKADSGYHLWSHTYDEKFADIFKIQDEIAESVVRALKVSLLEQATPKAAATQNSEAYLLYLQGNAILGHSNFQADMEKALDYANRAIALDPTFAPGWTLRADAYTSLGYWNYVPRSTAYEEARKSTRKSLELNPDLAGAHVIMAKILLRYDFDFSGAEQQLNEALRLDSNNASALAWSSNIAFAKGQTGQAVNLIKQSVALDPLTPGRYVSLASAQRFAGNLAESRLAVQMALDLQKDSVSPQIADFRQLLAENHPAKALEVANHVTLEQARAYGREFAYFALGNLREADAALALYVSKYSIVDPNGIAAMYACRGEMDQAFLWLDRAFSARDSDLTYLRVDPNFNSIRKDPRYAAFLAKMKFPSL